MKVSNGGYTITESDRKRFLSLADSLRRKHGFETEEAHDGGGMYDMTQLRDARN